MGMSIISQVCPKYKQILIPAPAIDKGGGIVVK